MSKFIEKPLSKNPSEEEREKHIEKLRTLIVLCNEVLDEEVDRSVTDSKIDHAVLDAPGARLIQLTALINELQIEEEYAAGDPDLQEDVRKLKLRIMRVLPQKPRDRN